MFEDIIGGKEIEKYNVPAVLLSDYIDRDVDLLKIDIEGAENLVMDDLVATGKMTFIKEMIMEYHHDVTNEHRSLAAMLHLLENNNFIYEISSSLRPPFSTSGSNQNFLIHAYRKS